ncbi:MAG: sensor histidine kinase, partial [Acidimicrobiales bacterium]
AAGPVAAGPAVAGRSGDHGAPALPWPVESLADVVRRWAVDLGAAGVDVTLVSSGSARPCPPGVEALAARVADEALSNLARHSQSRQVEVQVVNTAAHLEVVVSDPGPAKGCTAGSGHGLAQLARDVAGAGGELTYGTDGGGGFTLRACLALAPLPAQTSPDPAAGARDAAAAAPESLAGALHPLPAGAPVVS